MLLAQMFDSEGPRRDLGAEAERLRAFLRDSGTAPEERNRGPRQGGAIPMHECLSPLVPGGVLNRGTVIALPSRVGPKSHADSGPGYLALGLLAGATAGGAWAAAVGFPDFGIAAAAGLGAVLERFLLLDEPGDRWPEAVAVLATPSTSFCCVRRAGRPVSSYACSRARCGSPSGRGVPCWS